MRYSVGYKYGKEFAWFIALSDAQDFRDLCSEREEIPFAIFNIETGEEQA